MAGRCRTSTLAVACTFDGNDDNALLLREWIEFHRLVGATHFFVRDLSGRDDADATETILRPYVDAGVITLDRGAEPTDARPKSTPGLDGCGKTSGTRVDYWNECVRRARGRYDWLACLGGIDEFLVPTHANESDLLIAFGCLARRRPDCGAVRVAMRVLAKTAGQHIASGRLITECLVTPHVGAEDAVNASVDNDGMFRGMHDPARPRQGDLASSMRLYDDMHANRHTGAASDYDGTAIDLNGARPMRLVLRLDRVSHIAQTLMPVFAPGSGFCLVDSGTPRSDAGDRHAHQESPAHLQINRYSLSDCAAVHDCGSTNAAWPAPVDRVHQHGCVGVDLARRWASPLIHPDLPGPRNSGGRTKDVTMARWGAQLRTMLFGQPRVCVVMHVGYADVWPYYRTHLVNLARAGVAYDFYATVTEGQESHALDANLRAFGALGDPSVVDPRCIETVLSGGPNDAAHTAENHTEVITVPNRGLDGGAWLLAIKAARAHASIAGDYDLVLKMHTKGTQTYGAEWRDHLIDSTVGTPERVAECIATMVAYPGVGLLCAQDWIITESMRACVFHMADRMRVQARRRISRDAPLTFAAGTIFWARFAPLAEPLAGLDIDALVATLTPGYPRGIDTDGHMIERMFGLLTEHARLAICGVDRLAPIPSVPASWPDMAIARLSCGVPNTHLVRIRFTIERWMHVQWRNPNGCTLAECVASCPMAVAAPIVSPLPDCITYVPFFSFSIFFSFCVFQYFSLRPVFGLLFGRAFFFLASVACLCSPLLFFFPSGP